MNILKSDILCSMDGNGKCFKPYGSGDLFRTAFNVDTKVADATFKECKKNILNPFMKENGFLSYKSKAYVRLNEMGNIEYIDLQKEMYGSKTFTVNMAIIPVYIPNTNYLSEAIAERLGSIACGRDFWWDFKDSKTAEKSFKNVREALEIFAFDWFEKYRKDDMYIKTLKKKVDNNQFGRNSESIVCYYLKNNDIKCAEIIVELIESCIEKEENHNIINLIKENVDKLRSIIYNYENDRSYFNNIIEENFEKLKLPKSLKKDYEYL